MAKEMNLDEVRIAMVEITSGKTSGSTLRKKYPEHYAKYEKEIKEIKDKGGIVEIPPEVF